QSISCDCPVVTDNTIAASQTICDGDTPAGLTGSVPTIDPVTTFTYQWQSSPTGTGTWTDVATTQDYSPGALTASTDYRRVIKITGCTDDISNVILITVTPKVTPIFDPISSICEGDVLNPLPTISLNGIQGTWSPALNNTITTEYTFTPSVGECATTGTLTISVNEVLLAGTNGNLDIYQGDITLQDLYLIIKDMDAGGTWTETSIINSGITISDVTLMDFSTVLAGVYEFTYTHAAIGSCPEVTSTASLRVLSPSTGTISGNIYSDTNGNGIQDIGEPGLEELDVIITNSNGDTQTVTTDENGVWTAVVPQGEITIAIDETDEDYPTGYTQTEGDNPTTVTAIEGTPVDGGTDGFYLIPIGNGNTTFAENDFNNIYIDTPTTGNVLTNDEDFEGDVQRVTTPVVTSILGVEIVIDESTGDYTYIPPTGFVGSDVFKYTVCDDGNPEACDTALVFIEILPIGIESNNCDGKITSLTLRYTGTSTANIKVIQRKDDVVIFDQNVEPDETFKFNGTDDATLSTEISIFVNDELNTEIQTSCSFPIGTGMISGDFVIVDGYSKEGGQLGPIESDVYPIANPDNEITQINNPVSGDLISNDFDPDGEVIIINTVPVNNPTNGNVTINPDGTFSYTPNPDFVGEDSFDYEICDEDNLCSQATVNIIIKADNLNITQANDDAYNTEVNTSIDGNVLLNDVDVESDIQIVASETYTTALGVVINIDTITGAFTYMPPSGYVGSDNFVYTICDDGNPSACDQATVYLTIEGVTYINTTYAVNDTFITVTDTKISEDVLTNDFDLEGDNQKVTTTTVVSSEGVEVKFSSGNGNFSYTPPLGFSGVDTFLYTVCDDGIPEVCDEATVFIIVNLDTDHDGVADIDDIDDDNDGILDIHENHELDFDGDGIVNRLDIDSDNDGITDNVEWQTEEDYIPPKRMDSDGDGWDDAYDPDDGGIYYLQVDTDFDGSYDFLDLDSDNDNIPDSNEGHDQNHDNIPDVIFSGFDSDGDGLDDAYDTIDGWDNNKNPIGSNSPLQDFDGDNIRDWRDLDDDNDGNATSGTFNKLVAEVKELLIPEIFSPNGDGIQDYFRIQGIEAYPLAKIEIYNRWGNKVYSQENYGNIEILGTTEAWWDGYSNHEWSLGKEKLPPATYFYILYLNDSSKPLNGYLFLNR
ncbi:MAG: tandem-95 repeat protein, partial [Draconibacterium sp.]|nr:tandem-95 repeat protein [Draconibacterium sp.]